MQLKVLIYVLFFMSSKKNHQFSLFYPDFWTLVKSKMATIVGDVEGPQQRQHL